MKPQTMRDTRGIVGGALLLLLVTSGAQADELMKQYAWGSLRVLAGKTERKAGHGSARLDCFTREVRAEIRYREGQRYLIAAGRLEIDPATGDFTATYFPFLSAKAKGGGETRRFEATNGADSVQRRAGKLTVDAQTETTLAEPELLERRRGQMAALEKR